MNVNQDSFLYHKCITFKILDKEINLYSEELYFGLNTVAEIDNQFYYLGHDNCNIESAIFAWQEINNRHLTSEELLQTMQFNKLNPISILI